MPAENPLILTAPARAKLNLFLAVTGRRADGYHLLDSLVAFASIADQLTATDADTLTVRVSGPFAAGAGPDQDNLVLRAARALQRATGCTRGASLQLEKNLPSGAGLGGGSSDAAMTLRLLNRFWDLGLGLSGLEKIGLSLGADIPVCLYAQTARMSGIGEQLLPVEPLPEIDLVLVHPGVGLSTPAVFKALAGRFTQAPPPLPPNISAPGALLEVLKRTANDLETPACELLPDISEMLANLRSQPGCLIARMSGSGSACFGLFADTISATRAEQALVATHPHWWAKAGKLDQQ